MTHRQATMVLDMLNLVLYVYTADPYFIITNWRPSAKHAQRPSKVRGDTERIHLSPCAV